MKKTTLTGIMLGIGLISFIIFKNIYTLENRLNKDDLKLIEFENELLTIELPNNLNVEKDTTYLENGEIFNTVLGVGGASEQYQTITNYSLSIATYNKDFTNSESFHIDTLRKNLVKDFHSKNFQLIKIEEARINGIKGLKYVAVKESKYEKSVLFSLDNNVIGITMYGSDTTNNLFNKILTSVKIKLLN